jgi:hypothetical protein
MNAIDWEQFGLIGNPYDTAPLSEGGKLSIEHVFVGRDNEREFLNGVFASESHACVVICGDVGVGKTTLANMQKNFWKFHARKPLFSFRREIEASLDTLNKKQFILEIIGSVLREISLLDPRLLGDAELKKLNSLVDISYKNSISFSGNISLGIIGGNIGIDKNRDHPSELSMSSLELHLHKLIRFIKTHRIAGRQYHGLIVHMNNFDVVLRQHHQQVIDFFDDIRDLLQTTDLYGMFLGPSHFFSDISSKRPRIKNIFNEPALQLQPLSKKELNRTFSERMNLLRSAHVKKIIIPVADEVVDALYDMHNGDTRSVMASIKHMLSQYPNIGAKTLELSEAIQLLGKWQWEEINQSLKLTSEQKEILIYIARAQEPVNQKIAAHEFDKAQANMSGYYFKPLKEAGIIEIKNKEGREKFWGIADVFNPLKIFISKK